jgi:hypothetical protein
MEINQLANPEIVEVEDAVGPDQIEEVGQETKWERRFEKERGHFCPQSH